MRLSKSHARMRMWRSARCAKRTKASKYSEPSTSMETRSAWAAAQQLLPGWNRVFGIATFSGPLLNPQDPACGLRSSPFGLWMRAHDRSLQPPAVVLHRADGRVAGGETVVGVVLRGAHVVGAVHGEIAGRADAGVAD